MNRDDKTQEHLDYAGAVEQLDKFNRLLAELPKLSSHIDEKKLIQNIIDRAKELVNADHVHVRVIDWLKEKLVLEAHTEEENNGLEHPLFSSIDVNEAIGGYVFTNNKSETINDVRNNKPFENYLKKIIHIKKNSKDKDEIEKLKKLTDILESIEHAIVVPLYLEKKSIGVLTAWRRKTSSPFSKEKDMIVLQHFANQASVALRNAWLFKASTWQPSESESFTVETLCQEVVNEAIKRTGAMDGRVRFVNWEKEYLVPGALVWSSISRFSWNDVPGNDTERFKKLLINEFDIDWLETAEIKKNDDNRTINAIGEKYLFSWDEIPGNDNKRLIGFLKKRYNIEWADNTNIEKIDGSKTIRVYFKNNFLSLNLNDDETNVILKIDNVRADEFIAKTENDKLNIYGETNLSLKLNDDQTKVCLKIDNDIIEEFIVKTENAKLNIYISERDLRVSIRKISICPAGVVASEQKPMLVNDLKTNSYFKDFRNLTVICGELYKEQLEILQDYQSYIEENNSISSLKTSLHNFSEGYDLSDEAQKELNKRLKVELDRLSLLNDPTKSADSLEKHIKAVKILAQAWRKYIRHLEKWNSEVAVPILIGNKLIGVLNVHSVEKEYFNESDQAILQALASRVATSIMVHQQNVLNRIHEIEQLMTADRSFEGVASMVAEGIKEVAFLAGREKISTIFPLLYICNPMPPQDMVNDKNFGDKFSPQERPSASKDEQDLLRVNIRNNGLGFEAIKKLADKHMEPVFIVRENIDDPVSSGSESAQKHDVITTACLPLAFGGIVYGLLYIHIKRRYFFTELEKDTLNLFAAHAAIVLKNLKKLTKEGTYDDLCGDKLIKDSISIKQKIKVTRTMEGSK